MLKHARGVTLIEAMVVLAIMAIGAAIALPSFSSLISDYRTRTAAESMINGLKLARTEAIRRNTAVSFTLGAGGGWQVDQVGPALALQTRSRTESDGVTVVSLNSHNQVQFLPDGRVNAFDATKNMSSLTISGATGAETYRVDLMAGGMVRMCKPSITTAGDPRRC